MDTWAGKTDMADIRIQVGVAEDVDMDETILGKYRRRQEGAPRTEP